MSYAADLSSFNAPASQIDWAQYIAWSKQGDGVSRLIIRACDGTVHDVNWGGYVAAALANGIDEIIHYQFNNPDLNSAQVEADFLIALVSNSLRPQDTLMSDFEKSVPQADGVWALQWLQHVQTTTGHLPAFYSYLSYIESRLSTDSALAAYPLGLADYNAQQPPAPAPWQSYLWWQYSDRGSVPGIPGLVDVNQFFGGASVAIPQGPYIDYTVGKEIPAGTTLDLLAAQYGISVADIVGINPWAAPYDPTLPHAIDGHAIQLPGYPQAVVTPPPALTPAEQAWLDVGPVFKSALGGI